MKKLSLKDIARELNVSKTTVSLVLNDKGDENKISQETQQRIVAYAKEHNYVPNQLARGLSRGKSETIGLIIPNISDSFYALVAGHIERRAKSQGYTVLFSSSYEDPAQEKELIESMLNRKVDGLIIASTQKNQEDILKLKRLNFPFVLIDRHYPEIETNRVIVDNYGGTLNMTKHLIEHGRKCLGFISIKSDLEAMIQRRNGFESALRESGLKVDATLIKELDVFDHDRLMGKALSEMLKSNRTLDGLVFSTHYLAASGLRVLNRLNISVPKDIAMISFDELEAFDLVNPPITSSKQPVDQMGNHAVDILVDHINSSQKTNFKKEVLETRLMIRESSGD